VPIKVDSKPHSTATMSLRAGWIAIP
jgi:hypothetical protein